MCVHICMYIHVPVHTQCKKSKRNQKDRVGCSRILLKIPQKACHASQPCLCRGTGWTSRPPDVCFRMVRQMSSIAYEKTAYKLVVCGLLDTLSGPVRADTVCLAQRLQGCVHTRPGCVSDVWTRSVGPYCLFACLVGPLVTHLLVHPRCVVGCAKIALCNRSRDVMPHEW